MTLDELKSASARKLYARVRLLELCEQYKIDPNTVIGRSHRRGDVALRKNIAFIMRDEGFSSIAIGKALNRDHTTILEYYREQERISQNAV